MTMNMVQFFATIRQSLFRGTISNAQVGGINTIINGATALGAASDLRQLAYMLATAYHETAKLMVPVRETLASSDAQAIQRLNAAFAAKKLPQVKQPYWLPDSDGKSWFGRGLVQLTFKQNYQLMSIVTGDDMVQNPDRALDPTIAVAVLVRGMQRGCLSGRKLSDYFNDEVCDWTGARKIVNGTDCDSAIAGIANSFYSALSPTSIEPAAG